MMGTMVFVAPYFKELKTFELFIGISCGFTFSSEKVLDLCKM